MNKKFLLFTLTCAISSSFNACANAYPENLDAEHILRKHLEEGTLKKLRWDESHHHTVSSNENGQALLQRLTQTQRDVLIETALNDALISGDIKNIGWNCNQMGHGLWMYLSSNQKNAFVSKTFQRAVSLNTFKDFDSNNDYDHMHQLFLQNLSSNFFETLFPKIITMDSFKEIGWKKNGLGWKFLNYLSYPQKETFKKPILQQVLQGKLQKLFYVHYYNTYLTTSFNTIVYNGILQDLATHPKMTDTLQQLIDFTLAELNSGCMVFCHGQTAKWAMLQSVYRELLAIKTNSLLPDTFIALRFNDKVKLSPDDIQRLRKHGVTDVSKDRYNILFTTMVPFQNNLDSNSYSFIIHNSDFSPGSLYHYDTSGILDIFKDMGMEIEFKWITKNFPHAFEELIELYQQANTESGNYGNLIAFSIPEKLSRSLCYPAGYAGHYYDGFIKPVSINGKDETYFSEILKHYDQVSDLEVAIILAPEMLDPKKAAAAGIKMKYFSPMMCNYNEYFMAFTKKLAEIMLLVKSQFLMRICVANKTK